jgi:RecA-family ATPase
MTGEGFDPGAKAREGMGEPDGDTQTQTRYDQLLLQCMDSKGLRNIPSPEPIIENYLFRDSLAWIGGKPGHCKSFVAAEMACCIGTGRSWFGHAVKPGKVLYLIAEGASGFSDRIEAWEEYYRLDAANVTFLPVPIQFKSDIDVAAFGRLLQYFKPDVVVIDTQARTTVGYKENDSTDMGEFVEKLEELRRLTGTCFLIVHHEPRNGEHLRGSIALEGAATSILRTFKEGNQITVETQKQKDIEAPEPFDLQLFGTGKSAVLTRFAVRVRPVPLPPSFLYTTATRLYDLAQVFSTQRLHGCTI